MYSNDDFLIDLLRDSGRVSQLDIDEATAAAKGRNTALDGLIEKGLVSEKEVAQLCAEEASMPFVDLAETTIDPNVVHLMDTEVAERYKVMPLGVDSDRLVVAIPDPFDFEVLDSLPHVLSKEVDFWCAAPSAINQMLTDLFNVGGGGESQSLDQLISGESDDSDNAPVIKMVSEILVDAFKVRASDIHIEPLERSVRVRYRIDGVLHEVASHPRKLLSAMISRIKIMTGSMSIAEKRLPQDGRIQLKMSETDLDLRVSTIPTNHGESVVMRILDKSNLSIGLPQLGFFSDDQEAWENFIGLPDGILLVTGPTGSGKTTTLYACLNHINQPDRKIITVEDPVEYQLSGINQVQVKDEVGMDFSAALRSILRQAPNIIMIGEIRDAETANIAINASLTGHLVFSTLHTNDAPSAIARLDDIGVKPFLIASSLRAVLAQRLVRKLCEHCKQPAVLTEAEIRGLGVDAAQLASADVMGACGCDRCRNSGYKGRMGAFEIFKVDDQVRHMINENLSTPQLRRRARELGMRTMREDGIRKVLSGRTTASEVLHATMSDDR
ncbi:GspE/PulE family protein [Sulfuriroseicoccus oceanibius]|uniref:Type II/IV secretion system protein n=1 Tax=Sulfuriroseicoccus oceanibius TaxID=2707525 RepID=A0A6B3LB88_9BACT|nr:GspE/PulE family protein [Sulfuriroseicoccus oceanibius]QQL43986.1 type II/IV secretion system protein [Sulfuriroseicoccus oceanibius]